MMLYNTIKTEGAMQKVAGGLRNMALNIAGKADGLARKGFIFLDDKAGLAGEISPYAGLGGLVGALTNDGNRAAGAIGGTAGGVLGSLAGILGGWLLPIPSSFKRNIPTLTGMAASGLGAAGGGYLGGKLGAKIDSATGNHLTKWTNKLLGRD